MMDSKRKLSDYAVIMERPDQLCFDCMNDLSFPIHRAAMFGHVDCMKNIFYNLENSNILLDSNNNTPLHAAASAGQIESLKFLLDCTRVPVQHQNTQGETCVHLSALNHHLQCLKILLDGSFKKIQSLVYQRDNFGCTVLHCAVLVNDNDIALWLLQRFGKNIANVANGENVLPLHLAAAQGNIEFIRIATKYDAQMVNKRDKNGATPAFYAVQNGCLQCLKYLVNKAKADIRILTKRGQSLVHAACLNGHLEIVQWLFTKFDKSLICQQTSDAATPFHCAAYAGHHAVLKFLHKISGREKLLVVITDRRGNTALHLASMKGRVDCADFLLKLGADPEVRNKLGQTPIDIAEKQNYSTLSRLLLASIDGSQLTGHTKHGNTKSALRDPIQLVRPHSMSTSGYSSTALASEHYEIARAPFNRRRRIQESSGYTSSSSGTHIPKKTFQKSGGFTWKGKPVLVRDSNANSFVLADNNWMLKKKEIQDRQGFTDETTLRIANNCESRRVKPYKGSKNKIVDSQIQTDFDPLVDNIVIVDDNERVIFSSNDSRRTVFKPISGEKTPNSTNSLESCFSVDDHKQVKRRQKRNRENSVPERKSFDKSSSESDNRSEVRNDERSFLSLSSSNNTESSINSCAFVYENPTDRAAIKRIDDVLKRELHSDTEESGIFYERPNGSKIVAAVVHHSIENISLTNGIQRSTHIQQQGCFMVSQKYTPPASEISLPITTSPVVIVDDDDIGPPLSLPLLHDDVNLTGYPTGDVQQIEEPTTVEEIERKLSITSVPNVSIKTLNLTNVNAQIHNDAANVQNTAIVSSPSSEDVPKRQNSCSPYNQLNSKNELWEQPSSQIILSNPNPPPFPLMEMRRCIKNEQKALVIKRTYGPVSKALTPEDRELCRNKVSEIKKRLEEHFNSGARRLPFATSANMISKDTKFDDYKHISNNVSEKREDLLNAINYRYFGTSNASDSDLRSNDGRRSSLSNGLISPTNQKHIFVNVPN